MCKLLRLPVQSFSWPCRLSLDILRLRASCAMVNNAGEIGSPCLRPLKDRKYPKCAVDSNRVPAVGDNSINKVHP